MLATLFIFAKKYNQYIKSMIRCSALGLKCLRACRRGVGYDRSTMMQLWSDVIHPRIGYRPYQIYFGGGYRSLIHNLADCGLIETVRQVLGSTYQTLKTHRDIAVRFFEHSSLFDKFGCRLQLLGDDHMTHGDENSG